MFAGQRASKKSTHYSPIFSASLAGIGAIVLIVVEKDRFVIVLNGRVVDRVDKLLNELMGVMNRSLIYQRVSSTDMQSRTMLYKVRIVG
jgi:hypothetical protein